jgi:hypothetical protein
MDEITRLNLANLSSPDKELQNEAFFALMAATDQPVDWAYLVWDELVASLTHKDNHYRAIASQLLCQLAKSDPEKRILIDKGEPVGPYSSNNEPRDFDTSVKILNSKIENNRLILEVNIGSYDARFILVKTKDGFRIAGAETLRSYI